MRLLVIAVLALLPAGAVVAGPTAWRSLPQQQPAADCPQTTSHHAFDPKQPLKPRKLAELPPANAYSAVLRHDGKCEVPVVIKYGVGGR